MTAAQPNPEATKAQLEYWKTAISVAMHFNDMCIRTRWFGLTVVTTLFAGAAVSMSQDHFMLRLDAFSRHIDFPIATVLCGIVIVVTVVLWHLDLGYYYKMLTATITHATSIEPSVAAAAEHFNMVEFLTLTPTITKEVSRDRAEWIARTFYIVPLVLALIGAVLTGFNAIS